MEYTSPMLTGKRILFFVAPLYEDLELWYPKLRLEEAGYATKLALRGFCCICGTRF